MAATGPRICLAVPLDPHLEERIDAACDVVRVPWGAPREELLAAVSDAEGLLLSNQQPVDAEVLAAAPLLRVVAGIGVGYDRFDVEAATANGVLVCHTPEVVTHAVVDLVYGMVVALARRLFANEAHVRTGGWAARKRPPALGFDVRGKTLGIVGYGRIGREVATRAPAFGLEVVFNDTAFDRAPAGAPQVPFRALDDLLRESDIVTLHTDLNPTSRHLIGARELELMKPTAVLINTSRGPVVDQRALAAGLRDGAIAAAALDVLEQEPPDPAEEIVALPNVLTFPHIGTATEETRLAMRELAVRNLLRVLDGKPPETCVNPEAAERRRP